MELISGVMIKDLRVFPDQRGRLMEILRKDDDIFAGFGQMYMTTTLPGVVKAWHLHTRQTDMVCCVYGMIRLVIFDEREKSSYLGQFNEFFIGTHKPQVIHIPPMLYHGWQCVSQEEAIIINTVTEVYNYQNPDEKRLDPHYSHIKFDWLKRDG